VKCEPIYKAKYSASRDPREEERFYKFVRERNLYEKLMVLNSQRLNKAIKSDDLTTEIRKALLDFVYLEEGKPRFSPSKLKKKEY
jgi:hypothetical protein